MCSKGFHLQLSPVLRTRMHCVQTRCRKTDRQHGETKGSDSHNFFTFWKPCAWSCGCMQQNCRGAASSNIEPWNRVLHSTTESVGVILSLFDD